MANPNVRQPDETQKQFHQRRSENNIADKQLNKWRVLWPATKGTYIRARDGELG
jgi:hypothetical protein